MNSRQTRQTLKNPRANMTGIAVGLTKGHGVSRRKLATRPAQRKGVRPIDFAPFWTTRRFASRLFFFLFSYSGNSRPRSQKLGKRVKMIRDLVRDVAGSAPYEKRLMELLKVGRDKRALKLAKRKVRRASRVLLQSSRLYRAVQSRFCTRKLHLFLSAVHVHIITGH